MNTSVAPSVAFPSQRVGELGLRFLDLRLMCRILIAAALTASFRCF